MYLSNGQPIWRQIVSAIESDIAGGVYRPGDKLATEADLAKRFAVNRHTVRRAMAHLQELGKVRIEQGRGTFVQSDMIAYSISERTRFTQNIEAVNKLPGRTFLRGEQIHADAEVARNLGVRKGAPVIVLEGVSEADGHPMVLGTMYFPAKRFPNIIEHYKRTVSVTEALKACGVEDYKRFSTRISAIMPSRQLAAHLQQPPTRPVIQTESINVDLEGRTVEYGISYFASDRIQLIVEGEPLATHSALKQGDAVEKPSD